MSEVPRVLGVLPTGGQTAGAVFVRQLVRAYPADKLFSVVFAARKNAAEAIDWEDGRFVREVHPEESWSWRMGARWAWLTVGVRHAMIRHVIVPRMAGKVLREAERHRADVVWMILASPTLIYLARRLMPQLRARLAVMVWDPPERWAEELRMTRLSRAVLMRDFDQVIRGASSLGVASENMKDEYARRYGKSGAVLIHGLPLSPSRPVFAGPKTDGKLVIGVAGNLYSATEWYALLSALDSVNWRVEGRDVMIRVLGPNLVLLDRRPCRVEFLGWRPVQEALRLLAETDIAYLPYIFDPAFRSTVQLCFPNKLSSYLAVGLPVLFHGPEDSSPARFFRAYPAAACCHSLEPGPILDSLRRFVSEPGFYAAAVAAGRRAVDEELNLDVFLGRFADVIGCGREDLLRDSASGMQS